MPRLPEPDYWQLRRDDLTRLLASSTREQALSLAVSCAWHLRNLEQQHRQLGANVRDTRERLAEIRARIAELEPAQMRLPLDGAQTDTAFGLPAAMPLRSAESGKPGFHRLQRRA